MNMYRRRLERLEASATNREQDNPPIAFDERALTAPQRDEYYGLLGRCLDEDGEPDPARLSVPDHRRLWVLLYRMGDPAARAWIRNDQPYFAWWYRHAIGE